MPVPYGTSPQSSQPDLTTLLPLASAGAGLLAYLLAFLDPQAAGIFAGVPGFSIIAAAAAVGLRMLPKSPNTLYAAAPLAAAGALVLFQAVLRGGADALVIVIMVLALLQLGAVVGALLVETGVVGTATSQARPAPAPPKQANPGQFRPPQGGWSPPQQGGPAKPGHFAPPGAHYPPPPPPNRPQGPVFPPYGPPQGGWTPAQAEGPASPPSGSPPVQQGGGLSGTLLPPPSGPQESHGGPQAAQNPPPSGGQQESSPPGGPQGTQHLPRSASDES